MIKREILEELKNHLDKPEMSIIVGPRQAGKTTVMYMLKDFLEKKRKEQTLFLNLDIEEDRKFFESQSFLIQKIELELGREKGYVFIDEIQRKNDAGLFLKGLYDMKLPWKFIVSGSGSLELKEKIHESLSGRKRLFELNTISFNEYVNYRTNYKYEKKIEQYLELESVRVKEYLLEYLNYGGYPRIVIEDLLGEKLRVIDEIYQSVLAKDIAYLLRVEKVDAFSNLIKILSDQSGQILNYSELSSTVGLSLKTVQDYLWYAEKIFVLTRITPFFRNIRKEITKSPVMYFNDIGLRNYIMGVYGNVKMPSELGFLFQNFVFNSFKAIMAYSSVNIHFWRTKDKAEVDFVLVRGKEVFPVEVKFIVDQKRIITRSFRSFISKYKPKQAFVVYLGKKDKMKIDDTSVSFIPFHAINEFSKLKMEV